MLKTPAKPLIEEKNDIYNDGYKQKQKIKAPVVYTAGV